MFEWLRRRQQTDSPTPSDALAMVALQEAAPLDMSRLESALKEIAPTVSLRNIDGSETTATFEIDGRTGALTVIPMPIPWTDLEAPCQAAWWKWPGAEAAFKSHRAHVVLFVGALGNTVEAHKLLTALIAATIQVLPTVGVYCGSARLVHDPGSFRSEARGLDGDTLPITLWVGFHPFKNDGAVGAFTTGLPAFGHWDLLMRRSAGEVHEVIGLLASAADYVVSSGAKLRDGNTFGFSEDHRIRVSHEQSDLHSGEIVCVLQE